MHTLILLVALAPSQEGTVGPDRPLPPQAKLAVADPIDVWNELALGAIRSARTPPPLAARNLALLHAALFDTLNAIDGQPYEAYLFDRVAVRPMGHEVAAAACGAEVLSALYPDQAGKFTRARNSALAAAAPGEPTRLARGLGEYVGRFVVRARADDGHDRRLEHAFPLTPGVWRPTPPGYEAALLPAFGKVRRFALPAKFDLKLSPPPEMDSAEIRADLAEVRALGGMDSTTRTAGQTLIAHFWNDGAGTCTPPGHWNQIARAFTAERPMEVTQKARLFALLNLAMADAAVSCWECKFRYRLWRPVTALRRADAGWSPLLVTPPFPSYTSGHSTFSGAAATVLADVAGKDGVEFTVGSDGVPGTERAYKGFWEAAGEAGRSRIYGGIHYECDNREGLALGRRVAEEILRTRLRPPADPTRPRPPAGDGTRPMPRGPDTNTASAR
ncbi:MAG: vanadium-dependent haloperoxidase [Gemmataceae bacterium]